MSSHQHKSTLKRIEMIRKLAHEHYEEGNQSKCYAAVWRTKVYPLYGICYRTFLNYVNAPEETLHTRVADTQQTLFR